MRVARKDEDSVALKAYEVVIIVACSTIHLELVCYLLDYLHLAKRADDEQSVCMLTLWYH